VSTAESSAAARHEDAALRAKLARTVGRACPPWARAWSEDIVQAAMLRVLKVRASREGNDPLPSSYLWKVAYTATIDELRRLRARKDGVVAHEHAAVAVASEALAPDRRAESTEISRGIRDCVGALVVRRRQAVALYLQGHSVPETARLLQWPPKRAENMVYRGLADLRRCLASKGIEP
jgi:RNA polymerase sigma-70 factor (ECF subfamily)